MFYRRRIAFTTIIVLVAYSIFITTYPTKKIIVDFISEKTTTTTTPTPLGNLLQWNFNKTIEIEKYDALRVHMNMMKKKITRMNKTLSNRLIKKPTNSIININVHMLYRNNVIKKPVKKNNISSISNSSQMIYENMKAAQASGAGVLFLEYPYISMLHHLEGTEDVLKTFFNAAKDYDLKISLIINDYYERTIESIRKLIVRYIREYGDHPSVFKYKKRYTESPLIYIKDSEKIPVGKWKNLLLPYGTNSIRNTKYDAVILGHLRDEEHSIHIRGSNFDGFFTCCHNNGETYGSTWKNWQTLSAWATSHNMFFSAGINEGVGKVLMMKAALNTVLRCDPSPTFVFFTQMDFNEDTVNLAQHWTNIWTNLSNNTAKQYL